jgi:hypothetical protein
MDSDMIYVTIEQPGELDYRASATVNGVLYTARSPVTGSVIRRIVEQLAAWHDDQPIAVIFPTVTVTHRSLWDLAGIRNREERLAAYPGAENTKRYTCPVCNTAIKPPRVYCSNKCRQKAHRARMELHT